MRFANERQARSTRIDGVIAYKRYEPNSDKLVNGILVVAIFVDANQFLVTGRAQRNNQPTTHDKLI